MEFTSPRIGRRVTDGGLLNLWGNCNNSFFCATSQKHTMTSNYRMSFFAIEHFFFSKLL